MEEHRTGTTAQVLPGFGQRVYDLTVAKRRANGKAWTATDLAKAMGVTPAAVRAYFGGTVPRGKNLRKLADVLNVDVDQLLDDATSPRSAGSNVAPSETDTPDSVLAAYQRWVAKYYATGMSVPAALATQWMARMWQAKSGAAAQLVENPTVPFSPGNNEAAALVGLEGEILAVSDSLCEMLGVSEGEVIGRMGCDYAASEEDAELLRQSMLSPSKTPADLSMKNAAGQKVAVTAYPSDEKGEALQVTFLRRGVMGDTTTKDLPGIFVATMDGRIVLVNDRLANVYGMTREQIQGRNVWDLVVPEMQVEAKKRILTGATGPTRWAVCTVDGKRIIVDAVTTIEILNGQPMRVTRGWEAVGETGWVNGIPTPTPSLKQRYSSSDESQASEPR